MMEFGVHVPSPIGADRDEWQQLMHTIDRSGIHHVAVGDGPLRAGDAFTNLALIGEATQRVHFGTFVINPATRHPAVVANTVGGLHLQSGGRAYLGIGTGNNALRNLGLPTARLADLEAFVVAFRELLSEGAASYKGGRCRMPWAPNRLPTQPKVLIAANGPVSLRLAGAIGDGVIVGGGISRPLVESSLASIAEGAAGAGRDIADLDVWFQVDVNITDDGDAVAPMKNIMVAFASRGFGTSFEGKHVPPHLEEPLRRMLEEYEYTEHAAPTQANVALVDKHGLTDFLAERWLIAGDIEGVTTRLRELESYGVRGVHFTLQAPDRPSVLGHLVDEVIPRFATPSAT